MTHIFVAKVRFFLEIQKKESIIISKLQKNMPNHSYIYSFFIVQQSRDAQCTATVILAMGDGRRAAQNMAKQLLGE